MKSKLVKLLKNNTAKGQVSIKSEGEEATVYLYDAIGGWFGVESKDFVKELLDLNARTVHLRINSPGGDVFDARAIQTAIKQIDAKVIAHIDGLCASAATYIALAADEVEMSKGAFFMIHNAWTLAIGDADELRETASLLERINETIRDDYAKKTGIKNSQITEWMNAETWFTAEEAKENGFVDRVFDGVEGGTSNCWNLSAYDNAPQSLLNPPESKNEVYKRDRYEARARLFEATTR